MDAIQLFFAAEGEHPFFYLSNRHTFAASVLPTESRWFLSAALRRITAGLILDF